MPEREPRAPRRSAIPISNLPPKVSEIIKPKIRRRYSTGYENTSPNRRSRAQSREMFINRAMLANREAAPTRSNHPLTEKYLDLKLKRGTRKKTHPKPRKNPNLVQRDFHNDRMYGRMRMHFPAPLFINRNRSRGQSRGSSIMNPLR